jgi:hypothetical protein
MSAQIETSHPALSRRVIVALTLGAAALVAIAANTAVAFAGLAAGASTSFAPLMIAIYGPFSILGIVAGYIGWRIVRGRSSHPLRVLRVLVPVLLVLSFLPDTISAIVGFIPDSSATGFVSLMIMHVIVVGVGVPVFQRLAPVR